MSDVSIRRSTREDFDDVMKIGEVLPGVDYLWHRYNPFMDDPNATGYVAVVDNEVVAFCAAFLLDDGQTYHVRSGRVKEKSRGQGIYVKMLDHVRNEFQSVGSIKYDALVMDNRNFGSMKQRLLKKYQLLFCKDVHNYCSGTDKFSFKLVPDPSLKEMTSEEMTSLLENKKLRRLLFKSDRIVIDWVPLRILKSNMKYIMSNESKAMATTLEDDAVSLLTVGTAIPGNGRMKYVLDVFGDDVTLLRHHIVAHIHHIESLTDDWFLQIIHPSRDVVNKGLSDVAMELGLIAEDVNIETLYYLENPFC